MIFLCFVLRDKNNVIFLIHQLGYGCLKIEVIILFNIFQQRRLFFRNQDGYDIVLHFKKLQWFNPAIE